MDTHLDVICAVVVYDRGYPAGPDFWLEEEWKDENCRNRQRKRHLCQGSPPRSARQRAIAVRYRVLDGEAALPGHEHRQARGRVQQHGLAREQEVGEDVVEETVAAVAAALPHEAVHVQAEPVGDVQAVDDEQGGQEGVEAAAAQPATPGQDEGGAGVG